MRAVLAILAASLFSIANDGAIFKRGKDPHGKSMCACIGAAACSEMQKSDSCISGIECPQQSAWHYHLQLQGSAVSKKEPWGRRYRATLAQALAQSVGHATVYQGGPWLESRMLTNKINSLPDKPRTK